MMTNDIAIQFRAAPYIEEGFPVDMALQIAAEEESNAFLRAVEDMEDLLIYTIIPGETVYGRTEINQDAVRGVTITEDAIEIDGEMYTGDHITALAKMIREKLAEAV